MSSTSQKHRDFVGEPMGDKPVTDLAGIGGVLGGRLTDLGYDKVHWLYCCIPNSVTTLYYITSRVVRHWLAKKLPRFSFAKKCGFRFGFSFTKLTVVSFFWFVFLQCV